MSGRFVAIEDLDAVGKTTLAKLTAQKIGGVYYRTPPELFLDECTQIDKNGVNFDEKRFAFFVKTVVYASSEIKKLTAENRIVIVDRWIWTTFAYHFAANRLLCKKYENKTQDIMEILLEPSLSILVHISDEQIWLRRMEKRAASNCDQVILRNPNLRKDIFQLFLKLNSDFKLVENSGAIDDSAGIIMELLSSQIMDRR